MSYRINTGEEIEHAVKRIAREQVGKAVNDAAHADEDIAIHRARKRCKKMRGLIRIVRPFFPAYRSENSVYRDAARQLSSLRDATTLIETCERVAESLTAAHTGPARELTGILQRRRENHFGKRSPRKRLETFAQLMHEARARVDTWTVEAEGFQALAGGCAKTHERAFKAMRTAYASPLDKRFHEWRKRVKYHRYHLALLSDVWPAVMEPMRVQAKVLSDLLGEDHDLAVLRATLLDDPASFGSMDELQPVLLAIDHRRSLLQARALPLGERLFTEGRKPYVRRLGHWWRARQAERQLAALSPSTYPQD
jgi:CHAD domain-containing protein